MIEFASFVKGQTVLQMPVMVGTMDLLYPVMLQWSLQPEVLGFLSLLVCFYVLASLGKLGPMNQKDVI